MDNAIPRSEGGQPGNQNAVRHGLRMELHRLPKGCSRVRRQRDGLRRCLEAAVLKAGNQTGGYEAAGIQTACKWQQHAALLPGGCEWSWANLRQSNDWPTAGK